MQPLNLQDYSIETSSDLSKLLDSSENEELYTKFDDIVLILNETNNGTGNVHLTNLKLIWLNNDSTKLSYSFPYKSMMFHAISKDINLLKTPCIFIQLNLTDNEEDNQSVLLSPSDSTVIESLFDQISKLSTINDTYSSDDENNDVNFEIYEEE